ncbi:enoyl-CoA delta isomerase 1, mitochondrial-like [Zerene cesonia]|uniref:enoyl-CoA delta isomerase 1, mitochondrial-like n=1 Tax=Zerene cesonia TaxID=33412 RepID=UPI0018E54FE1|nr:enoyl-CoA delta isomerase 1, mitochondrial-like [Zerene cesonia]
MIFTRQGIPKIMKIAKSIRPLSSGSLSNLSVDNEGVAILTLNRPPVNSLNLELLQEIDKILDEAAQNKFKALIFTSATPTVFTAGLDLMEMNKPDLKRAALFWSTFQEVWLKIFESSFITAAAITGQAPAGGCIIATSCEYRTMVSGKYKIGLNETTLGVSPPIWIIDALRSTISPRQAEIALTTGKMFTVEEAFELGLIDEVAIDKEDAINKCKQFIKRFDNISPLARSITKKKLRTKTTEWLKANRQADVNDSVKLISRQDFQKKLEIYIQSLKQREQLNSIW